MPDTLSGESFELQQALLDPSVRILAHLAKNAMDWEIARPALADLVPCDFPGYAPQSLTDWEAFNTENELIGEALTPEVKFSSGNLLVPQGATAVYLTIAYGADAPVLWEVFPLIPPFTFETPSQSLTYQFRAYSHEQSGEDPQKVWDVEMEEIAEVAEPKARAKSALILSRRRTATKALAALETVVKQDEREYYRSVDYGKNPVYVTGDNGTEIEKSFKGVISRLRRMLGK